MTMENEDEDAEGTGDRFDDENGIIGMLIKSFSVTTKKIKYNYL